MGKVLIAQSTGNPDCGFSGVVPQGEEWYLFRSDTAWGPQGEFLVASAGESSNVTRCHAVGQYIGIVNGQNFHNMRKYRIEPDPEYFDCINGACIVSTQYNTPGLYQSLEECEVNCGTGCSGKCISNSEWSQIESLSNQLKSKNCS